MSQGPEPTPSDVPEHAIPATYRRAPRSERFILTGIGIGAFVGLVVGLLLPAGSGVGRGTAGLLFALAGALAGGLISGAQVAFMEYTSGRSADRQRRDIETDWAPVLAVKPEPSQVSGDAASVTDSDSDSDSGDGDSDGDGDSGGNGEDGKGDGSR